MRIMWLVWVICVSLSDLPYADLICWVNVNGICCLHFYLPMQEAVEARYTSWSGQVHVARLQLTWRHVPSGGQVMPSGPLHRSRQVQGDAGLVGSRVQEGRHTHSSPSNSAFTPQAAAAAWGYEVRVARGEVVFGISHCSVFKICVLRIFYFSPFV